MLPSVPKGAFARLLFHDLTQRPISIFGCFFQVFLSVSIECGKSESQLCQTERNTTFGRFDFSESHRNDLVFIFRLTHTNIDWEVDFRIAKSTLTLLECDRTWLLRSDNLGLDHGQTELPTIVLHRISCLEFWFNRRPAVHKQINEISLISK